MSVYKYLITFMSEDKYLTPKEIRDGCIEVSNGNHGTERLCVINQEFSQSFDFISRFPKSVSIFGSARFNETNQYYQQARELASRISRELDYAIVTGGGPGIMEAANRGAHEAGGASVGLTISLPHEQTTNPYVTHELAFYYFFSRKVTLAYAAEAYIYFPGGFGTMDELFEILTLVQTKKIPPTPVILCGVEFWQPLMNFITSTLAKEHKTISPEDLNLLHVTDDHDMIIELIKKAPVRERA